jgi:predicted O-methyltransferase YrrM
MKTESGDIFAFLTRCYRQLLGREPDANGFNAYVAALQKGLVSRAQVVLDFFESSEFLQRSRSLACTSEFVVPGHYYSALPSKEDRLRAMESASATKFDLSGIDMDWEGQERLLETLLPFLDAGGIPEKPGDGRRYGLQNPSFGVGDALFLQAMMRHFRPGKIVEVGSGHTSAMMLDVNDLHLGNSVEFEFIEPYPELLRSLLRENDKQWRIHSDILQQADLGIFRTLKRNDILFIDSTHVLKAGSDVCRIFFEVLPCLAPGVVVHFHDILWPFEYPANWLNEGRAWNEAYALRAFLQYNKDFSIILWPNALVRRFPDWFEKNAPRVLKNPGGSIWLARQG